MGTDTSTQVALIQTAILVFLQAATLIALIVYVKKTWEMASATRLSAEVAEKTLQEMKNARDQEIAPYVVAYFDLTPAHRIIHLVIKNIGKSMATDVVVAFDPPTPDGDITGRVKEVIGHTIPSLPPDYEIRTIFDSFLSYMEAQYPLSYRVQVSYNGGVSAERRSLQYTLDLSHYRGIVFTHQATLNDFVEPFKRLVSTHDKVVNELRALHGPKPDSQ